MNDKAIDLSSEDAFPINFNKKTLAELFLNFLGKKEKLSFRTKADFLIRLNDIEQFYYLLNSKISKEQNIFIEHFSVTFEYNDDTSKTAYQIDGLNRFNETRDVIPRSVSMFWNIVTKYPNAETIENQKIECSFIKNTEDKGDIILEINHTNQAWGIEVLNLFTDKIAQLVVEDSKKYTYSKKAVSLLHPAKEGFMALMFLFIFFGMIYLFIVNSMSSIITGKIEESAYKEGNLKSNEYHKLLKFYKETPDKENAHLAVFALQHASLGDIKKSVENKEFGSSELNSIINDIIEEETVSKISGRKFLFKITSSFLAIWIGLMFYFKKAVLYYGNKSFILINVRSEKEYDEYNRLKNKTGFYTLTAFIVAALSGVVGNIIYSFL